MVEPYSDRCQYLEPTRNEIDNCSAYILEMESGPACIGRDVTSRTTKVSHSQGPYLPQVFSSEPSEQSFSPLQNKPLSIQFPSPQARKPSWQRGSSVNSKGFTLRSLFFNLQFFTESFQSQVCLSMSKYNPAGQRMAWRPCNKLLSLLRRNRLNSDLSVLPKMCTELRHDSYLPLPPPTGTIHQHLYLYKVQLRNCLLFSVPALPVPELKYRYLNQLLC